MYHTQLKIPNISDLTRLEIAILMKYSCCGIAISEPVRSGIKFPEWDLDLEVYHGFESIQRLSENGIPEARRDSI